MALRVLSANQNPDHDTIAEFRRTHLEALSGLFMQVLRLCQKAGLVKLGHVALDGTKVKFRPFGACLDGNVVESQLWLQVEG